MDETDEIEKNGGNVEEYASSDDANNKRVILNDWQSKVWKDNHRFIVLRIGRRGGKSYFSALKIISFVSRRPNAIVYYVAPTYSQAKNIMWEMLKQLIPPHWIEKAAESELKFYLKNKARIELKGADVDPDKLRGIRIDFLVCDEIAFFRNWDIVWDKVLRPTLIDSKGKAIFISSPNGYDHFYKLYMKSFAMKRGYDKDFSSYHFTSYDNNYIDKEEIDKAKAELDDDTFRQEFMAEFRRLSGAVLPYFKRETHVIDPLPLDPSWTYYRGIDFGWVHPSACVFVAISTDGVAYVIDEIKQARLVNPDFASLIKQRSAGRLISQSWGDSVAQSDIREMNNYGLIVSPVSKTSGSTSESFTKYKVRKLNEKLKNRKLFIFSNCSLLQNEIENWQYREVSKNGQLYEIPVKLNDDLIDALSYVIVSIPEYFEPSYVRPKEDESAPAWAQNIPSWSSQRKQDINSYLKRNAV